MAIVFQHLLLKPVDAVLHASSTKVHILLSERCRYDPLQREKPIRQHNWQGRSAERLLRSRLQGIPTRFHTEIWCSIFEEEFCSLDQQLYRLGWTVQC
jgi:hypothetical protein